MSSKNIIIDVDISDKVTYTKKQGSNILYERSYTVTPYFYCKSENSVIFIFSKKLPQSTKSSGSNYFTYKAYLRREKGTTSGSNSMEGNDMEGIARISMRTYYLFVPESSNNLSIAFIKICIASDKQSALTQFQNIMDNLSEKNMFLREEIVGWIKRDDELTEQDNELIKRIGILPDIT